MTNSIIDTFPQHSYTIVSPTDELYPVVQYGWHEELLTFINKCEEGDYTIPTENVCSFAWEEVEAKAGAAQLQCE